MANELTYGSQIHLQSGPNGEGGYLDVCNPATGPGSRYQAMTNDSPTRDKGTGTWEIVSADGKTAGSPVVSGDRVHLRNMTGGDGGYLDVSGYADASQKTVGGRFDVSTADSKNRDNGSGTWQVFARTSNPADGNVRIGDLVLLWNTFGNNGGFLEINGRSSVSIAKFDLCTNSYYNRSGDVADWRIVASQA
ncbi:hypothetical protein R1T08_14755 [Streptomyces sp. SBC-4]|nr:hypothetical protein [Streptomyces sp. SBC-4]MDV5145438.1 hypothetical protein [Streptomyces sp. SBC-4]